MNAECKVCDRLQTYYCNEDCDFWEDSSSDSEHGADAPAAGVSGPTGGSPAERSGAGEPAGWTAGQPSVPRRSEAERSGAGEHDG